MKILVTGGAGYIGSKLVPKLLEKGFHVRVLDWFLFDDNIFKKLKTDKLELIKGDLRNSSIIKKCMQGIDIVIHLGCLSNDPSCDLDEKLTRSINLDAGINIIKEAKKNRVARFINASSASVYGIKDEKNVTESSKLEPITLYAKYKADLEEFLHKQTSEDFSPVSLRPATVCGYAPRLRLDLTVNILTHHAIANNKIVVYGGEQKRPNIHIDDLVNIYLLLTDAPKEKIHNQVFNAGFQNYKVIEIANLIKSVLGPDKIKIEITENNDHRSYHISSEKIKNTFNFSPQYDIKDAVLDLVKAFENGLVKNPNDLKYRNVKHILENKDLINNKILV
ncbi:MULTISPECIES: NAD-dependent epimerase/dehydratase family protein [Bacillus]|uniref:NAD-dependent epimerase/dehydratase family protein n=1 Tax=Bacillus TaxID=1386 RepID=UPI00227E7626|nr:NAD-dependent epimerase/dehydratase family protein [Bacillus safensis]MCY7569481.1 NAD-dependent epimerase/dehydratase family protein [Bacillus safensis]